MYHAGQRVYFAYNPEPDDEEPIPAVGVVVAIVPDLGPGWYAVDAEERDWPGWPIGVVAVHRDDLAPARA